MVPDLPRRFGGYAPENFDRGFAGSITAAEALRRSLNLPAVALLDRVGPLRFAATLRAAGATLRLPRGADPSLPLALGGDGITLRHAAALYAALATDGTGGPLRLLADAAAAASGLPRRAAPRARWPMCSRARCRTSAARGIAWKTGTSWGGRDAWAFGFDRATSSRYGSDGRTARRCRAPPAPRSPCRCCPACSTCCRKPRAVRRRSRSSMPSHRRGAPMRCTCCSRRPGRCCRADGPVTIRVMGGRRPLTFLVDGAPLPADRVRREAAWLPSGPGFYRLTVLDADGTAVRATVQVRANAVIRAALVLLALLGLAACATGEPGADGPTAPAR